MTIVRYPFPAELDEHEAQWETEEGELIAGLAHLDSLAVPAGEPSLPPRRESFAWGFVGIVLIVVGVLVCASAGYFLR